MVYFFILIGLLLIISLYSFIEQKFLVITSYTIDSDKLDKEFDGKSLVVLADLHNKSFGKDNERLINKINKIAPDYIIIAGDLVTKQQPCIPSAAYTLVRSLAKVFKVYYAYGNHEQCMEALKDTTHVEKMKVYNTWVQYVSKLKELGVKFLDNESFVINGKSSNIRITGISIGGEYFDRIKPPAMDGQYLDSLLDNVAQYNEPSKFYEILIAHNPIYYSSYAKWGADLVISGHLHGGVIRLPYLGGIISPQLQLFPKHDAGMYNEAGLTLIVSRGLGTHSGMPRIFNRPELISIKLKSNQITN